MNPLHRALRPASRRILATRAPVLASSSAAAGAQARRWQHSSSGHGGPIDPIADHEMAVGELEGAKFRIEPLRRTGEDTATTRARLTYQSRKRGTLESDLLLSTFAAAYLPTLSPELLAQYDLFLDENDWDIYYWATQTPPTSPSSSSTTTTSTTTTTNTNTSPTTTDKEAGGGAGAKLDPAPPAKGEWAQTIGTFKPAFRPVPARWRDSEILELLRQHVKARSAAGVLGNNDREKAEGMAFMPPLGERK